MTREQIDSIVIGTLLQRTFDTVNSQPVPGARWGNPEPVTEIFARQDDVRGRRFICFYTRFGVNGQMSGSVTEGEGHVRIVDR